MKIRLLVAAAAAALTAVPLAGTSQATYCNPDFPAACVVVDTVCMHGKLCQ